MSTDTLYHLKNKSPINWVKKFSSFHGFDGFEDILRKLNKLRFQSSCNYFPNHFPVAVNSTLSICTRKHLGPLCNLPPSWVWRCHLELSALDNSTRKYLHLSSQTPLMTALKKSEYWVDTWNRQLCSILLAAKKMDVSEHCLQKPLHSCATLLYYYFLFHWTQIRKILWPQQWVNRFALSSFSGRQWSICSSIQSVRPLSTKQDRPQRKGQDVSWILI